MSIDNFFNRSFTDSVLGDVEPTKPYVNPASEYPLCPDCGSFSNLRTASRGQYEYICKNIKCSRNFNESTKDKIRKELNNPPCPDCESIQVHQRGIDKKTGETKYTCFECLRNFRESTRNVKSNLLKQQNINIALNYELPICPSCAGQKLEKRGFEVYKDGTRKQKYRCKACDTGFIESANNRPACPDCGVNSWIWKQGIDRWSNKQRFFCKKCLRSFTVNSNPPCPDCGSLWIRKKGICKQTKVQKYYCNNCSRLYTKHTKNKPKEINPPCPNCSSEKVKKHGKNKLGSIRYRCNSCKEFFFEYRDNPPCPDCQSIKIVKAGIRRNKQQYRCKECQRFFNESTKFFSRNSPQIYGLNSDYWDLREMGAKFTPSATWFTANFEKIEIEWLREASKKYVKHLLISKSGSTCLSKLEFIAKFSRFLISKYPGINCSDINRDIIINYYAYLKQKYPKTKSIDTRRAAITNLDEFVRLSDRFKWLEISNVNLIFPEDLPKLSKSGKTFDQIIPDEVLEQLVDNLDGLPIVFARMAFLMLGAPIRVSEVCGMRFNCIKQDKDSDWWLHFWDFKLNKEHNPIPIRKEVADMIKLQQQFIKNKLTENYEYLFCAKKSAARKDGTYSYTNRPPSASSFRDALKKLVKDRNITYQEELYLDLSKTHQFRHTGASDLINKGMPLVMVQEILGHESPEMTLVYAKLYDDTLKETWKKVAPIIVDITGKVTKVETSKLDAPKYQEMKKIALEQQVNNGICGLSVHQKCPKFHACYTCSKFKVTPDNLPGLKNDREQLKSEVKQLKKQLDFYKQENKLRLAEGCRDRIKQSREIIANLNKMIDLLESDKVS